jgi:thiol:disulfide interchange protein DsbD
MITGIALLALISLSPFAGLADETVLQKEDNVSVAAKLSQDGVHSGAFIRAALLVTVRKGWHVNSASPSDENLIATSAVFLPPPGLTVAELRYPRGTAKRFAFSDLPLDVYEGTVIIVLKISVAPDLKPGEYTLPVEISYQACNNDVCLPPSTARVVIPVHVLAPDVPPVPANPGLFSGSSEN